AHSYISLSDYDEEGKEGERLLAKLDSRSVPDTTKLKKLNN
ncbi:12211_t:CDS:1, partial [Gigaspora rosea]